MPMCWGLNKQTTAPLGGGQTIKKQDPMGESGVTGSAPEREIGFLDLLLHLFPFSLGHP